MTQSYSRLATALAVGLVTAAGLTVQAASGVMERRAPESAIALNPTNGMALEQAAYRRFSSTSTDPTSVAPSFVANAASKARPLALASYQAEPLVPKSLAILALATPDMQLRRQVLSVANRLNRRDLALQLAVLENKLSEADEAGTVATLDQLLRVHPEYSDQFFPPLQQALLNPETKSTFAQLLNGSSPWHEKFALYAVRDEAARVRLARIRSEIEIGDERFDRLLIAGLASQGEFQLATQMYELASKTNDEVSAGVASLSWGGDYPPFDWQYLDRKDIRAQPSIDGDELEVFVRPGQGGVIANRIIALPSGATGKVAFKLQSTRPIVGGRMRISLYCADDTEASAQLELSKGENELNFAADNDSCASIRLEIYARAYRGEPLLRARIGRIRVS